MIASNWLALLSGISGLLCAGARGSGVGACVERDGVAGYPECAIWALLAPPELVWGALS